ncbi:MAG: SRPBCC family protein [Actinomycetes bacterium]
MPRLAVDQIISAPPHVVWEAVTDWPGQSQWVLATSVFVPRGDGRGIGGQLEAFTGFGRFGVRDPMTVTEWDPPRRCVVEHRGDVVRGRGIIEVVALPEHRSRLVWIEEVDLPLGVLGRLGWPVARPVTAWGIRRSLRRFAGLVEAGTTPETTART